MTLLEYRLKIGKNQSEMARQIGITRQWYIQIETGRQPPGRKLSRRIERKTGGAVSRLGLMYPDEYGDTR